MVEPQESISTTEEGGRRGERRATDRRKRDRRRSDRRLPVPLWRRSWALVAYGVVGALAAVGLYRAVVGGPARQPNGLLVNTPAAPVAETRPVQEQKTAEAAYTTADFERLVILGPQAVGRRVRAQLFCEAPSRISVRRDIPVEAPVAPLVDSEGHTAAAECRWGTADDPRREDFVLIVPPDLAARFAAAPVTTDDFVQRRHLFAEVEWVGRSQALNLRTAGVLRDVLSGPKR